MRDEDAHAHVQPCEGLPDALLLLHGPAAHAVVLERGESFGGHELELRDEILAGELTEHAEVRRVAEMKFAARWLRREHRGRSSTES